MESIKITSIKKITRPKTPVYDITVSDNHNFILENDLVVHNCQPYSVLKNAVYDKRISLLRDKDQFEELISLVQYEGGRVDKNMRGISDDAAQTLAGWVFAASLNKEKYIQSHAVLESTFIGSTTAEKRALEDQTISPKLVTELLQNEFGAPRVPGYTGLREAYEKAFGTGRAVEVIKEERNPFNFF